ncbi:Beta-mannosidase [Acidisarcina polymorpha]|uniref:Beta-mannosidase n=1 Tax=Acidisarcina polymorpha TaxID=2211140 RepID=A0A2Z5G279_9BACT|nr:Beta-mannosidase [Acidisarcina polymorpha]
MLAQAAQSSGASSGVDLGFTRGIGLYPGAPSENFAPELIIDASTYRNLALLRPAYHSSSYDYNLTAQLVTDGIKDTHLPTWISTSVSGRGILPKAEREMLLDHFHSNLIELEGPQVVVQFRIGGGEEAPSVDRLAVFAVLSDKIPVESLTFTVSVSEDGREWQPVGKANASEPLSPTDYPPDITRGRHLFYPSIPLQQTSQHRYYQVECACSSADFAEMQWGLGQVEFYQGERRVQIGGPYSFTSAWMSAGLDEEWVYVDLGARCEFDRIALYWIARAAEGSVQVSDDARSWSHVLPLPGGSAMVDDLKLATPAKGRYVRVLMTRPTSPDGYILSELEVYGRGGPIVKPRAMPLAQSERRIDLAGGAWRLQRASLVTGTGESLSHPEFKNEDWVVATVPGTALTSYFNARAIPDPNFGENQLHISDSFFCSDFWYRTEFNIAPIPAGEIAWLNLDGINWKADVFLNGEKLGRIEGGFHRGQFDITAKLAAGKPNILVLKVEKNATPGSTKQKTLENVGKNGGALGADNPTYHASIGWDWIPTIRGRNSGIWGNVYLTLTGQVTLENPFITCKLPLPDTSSAEVTVNVDLVNHGTKPISGTLRGLFGSVPFEQHVVVEASTRKSIQLDPTTHPELRLKSPELWWPAGYGAPHLYDVELRFEMKDRKVLDKKTFKAGVRQFTYSEENSALKIWINGRRFIARGGNWGFGESMLRYRAREYDASVRYHREMNFTMIRNWVGQIGDDAFYEACDRHGIVVWQDFWLANPWDGPIPEDNDLFMSNAKDFVLRIRNHASIGLYCGRNEGIPPKPLEDAIRKMLPQLHPGLHYIPSSADLVVSGHGPYQALPPVNYFRIVDAKLHSEIGMPNIPSLESVKAMMPETALWPQGLSWGLHDFCLDGAQGGSGFRSIIDHGYGGATSAEEWISLAQFVNYEGYRAMFEAQSKYRMGLLLWMSHPCWPSFVWQTYDYFLEPTSAYFGCKKASEPLHIQWNRLTDTVEVVNYNGGNATGLTAKVDILNMNGSTMWSKTATLDSAEDSTSQCIPMEYPTGLDPVHFLRLSLTRGATVLSKNIYMRGRDENDYRAIRQLAKAKVRTVTSAERQGDLWWLTTNIENTSAYPALMVRLQAVRESTGDRILPAIYEDNYLTLMPGDRQTIKTELRHADTRGERPRMVIGGFNVEPIS